MLKTSLARALPAVALCLAGLPGPAHAEDEHSGHEEEEKNKLFLFLGVTDEEEESAFSLGLDYDHLLTRVIGVGGFADYSFGDIRAFVLGAAVYVHPGGGWVLLAGPGWEDADDREALFRVGVGYEFEVGSWLLAPAFNVDFVDNEEILVYGLSIGKAF